jgi:superfamily II DNA or RNA helicase
MSYQLRPYQSDLLDRIDKAWFAGSRSILAQLPTGGGKTIVFSTVVHHAIKNGLKSLVLAHRFTFPVQIHRQRTIDVSRRCWQTSGRF